MLSVSNYAEETDGDWEVKEKQDNNYERAGADQGWRNCYGPRPIWR